MGRTRWLLLLVGLLTPAFAGAEPMQPPASRSLLLDGARAGARLIVVGERGHILISDDDATSWRQVPSPTRALLTAVHMHDAALGWAVGHDAVILRTENGGETWRLVHRAPEEERPLLDVWFANARSGFAVGAYGYFLATADGGETWTSRAVGEDDYHLNVLAPADGRRLFIGAEAGMAYRSDDGGASWRTLSPPYSGSWFGALTLPPATVLLAGLRGHLFRSPDGGETWERIPSETEATLTGIVRLPSGGILVTGLEGVLLESRDGGRSVSLDRLPERAGISAALPLADGNVLLIGEFGLLRLVGDR